MVNRQVTVGPLTSADIPLAIELGVAQEVRQHELDPRLEVRSRDQVAAALERQRGESTQALVARDEQGRVRGYVTPSMWEIPPGSDMRTFFTARNGSFDSLVLPAPMDEDAGAVAKALLAALNDYWRSQHTTGDMLRWPSRDLWLEPLLLEDGFLVDSILAYRSPGPLPPANRPASPLLRTRLARPEDEDALVRLHLEEIAFHLPYIPFVHMTPALETQFRARLAELWRGESVEDGAPLVLVVEREGEIVAMAENELMEVKPGERTRPGFLLTGRYGYLNNVGVSEHMRGQGVGRLLVQAVFDAFSEIPLDGYMLWFTQANPLASNFWPRMGFVPLWRTYQRLARA